MHFFLISMSMLFKNNVYDIKNEISPAKEKSDDVFSYLLKAV